MQNKPLKNDSFCFFHSEKTREKHKEAMEKGGNSLKRSYGRNDEIELKNATDVLKLLEQTANDLRQNKASNKTAVILNFIANTVLRGNLKDRVALEDLINKGKEVHFVKEGLILHKEAKSFAKLQFDIQNGFARFFLNNLSDEVKKAYDVLVDDGFYPHPPPLGYNQKLVNHIAVIDLHRKPFIKRIFELYATGEYSELQISNILYKEGLRSRKGNKVGKSSIGKILNDPFYYDWFRWKGELKRGNHDKIIDKELFDKVQEVLNPKKKRGYKHDFAFVGIMRCGECGNGITAELQKGKVYYRCTKPKGAQSCKQKYVREDILKPQLESIIESVALDLQKIKVIKDIMRISLEDEQEYVRDSLQALNAQYSELESQSATLLDLRLKNKVKEEVYDKKSKAIDGEMEKVNAEIAAYKKADRAYIGEIESLLDFCNEAPVLFSSSRPALQRELLSFVVSNLVLKDKKIEFSLKTPFDIVAKYSKNENWQGCSDSN